MNGPSLVLCCNRVTVLILKPLKPVLFILIISSLEEVCNGKLIYDFLQKSSTWPAEDNTLYKILHVMLYV